MNVKTRLFSLVLLAILVIPVFFSPPKSGNVLGVREKSTTSPASQAPEPVATPDTKPVVNTLISSASSTKVDTEPVPATTPASNDYKLKDISSGIRDIKKQPVTRREVVGKVIWDTKNKSAAVSDKFGLGNGVNVAYNGKSLNLVIGDTRVLSPDVLMSVDQKTFGELGGDPEKQQSIEVKVTVE